MSLIERIRADQLSSRKEKNIIKSNILTTLIGEASNIGKNDGNRESTDSEVISIRKKFIKNIDETMKALKFSNDARIAIAHEEKLILENYLPGQLNEEELRKIIETIKSELTLSQKDMGKLMSVLKARYDGQYDGKIASSLAKEILC